MIIGFHLPPVTSTVTSTGHFGPTAIQFSISVLFIPIGKTVAYLQVCLCHAQMEATFRRGVLCELRSTNGKELREKY